MLMGIIAIGLTGAAGNSRTEEGSHVWWHFDSGRSLMSLGASLDRGSGLFTTFQIARIPRVSSFKSRGDLQC